MRLIKFAHLFDVKISQSWIELIKHIEMTPCRAIVYMILQQ